MGMALIALLPLCTNAADDDPSHQPPSAALSMPEGAIALLELNGLEPAISQFEHSELLQKILHSDLYQEFADSKDYKGLMVGRAITRLILRMDLWTFGKKFLGEQVSVGIYPKDGNDRPDLVAILRPDPGALASQRLLLGPALYFSAKHLKFPNIGREVTVYELPGGNSQKTEENEDADSDSADSAKDGKLGGKQNGERSSEQDGQEKATDPDKASDPLTDSPSPTFLALHKEWVVFATDRKLLLNTLLRLTQESPEAAGSIAANKAYQLMTTQMGSNHHARLFVANSAIAKATDGRLGLPEKLDNPLGSLLAGGILELAVRSPYTGVTLDFKRDHFDLKTGLAGTPTALDEHHQYAFSDFPKTGTQTLPRTQDLIAGFTMYRDISDWYRRRDDLIQAQVLPEFDKFETGIGNLLPGKDIGEDVLPLLGNRITFLSGIQQYDHLDGEPGIKLPGFAFIIELKQEKEATDILQLFFQTLLAVLNLQAGEQDRQPWLIETEMHGGTKITFARYLDKPTGERLPIVFNFLPASARVGNQYVVSSSLGLCRQIIDQLQLPEGSKLVNENLQFEFAFEPFVKILEANRDQLVAQRLKEGRSASQANSDIASLLQLLRHFDALRLTTQATEDGFQLQLKGSWK